MIFLSSDKDMQLYKLISIIQYTYYMRKLTSDYTNTMNIFMKTTNSYFKNIFFILNKKTLSKMLSSFQFLNMIIL